MNTEADGRRFEVTIFSFGFKYGMPDDANLIWDVRFLPNPYWEEPLRHLTGKDERISSYVLDRDGGREFIALLLPLLRFLIEQNRAAGKPELKIGIGCTGGHHRSVAVVERIAAILLAEHLPVSRDHRDIERE